MFEGRDLVVATMHKKEKVIAPILEKELRVKCIVPNDLDTDQLGTFTGEVDRVYDPITTAKKKCELAMAISNCTLAVANEGSFGAHPSIFFVPADEEIIVFLDKENDLEVIVKEVSTETNFKAAEIKGKSELVEFANTAGFPSHGIILKSNEVPYKIYKGLTDWSSLLDAFNHLKEDYPTVCLETDMRACFNPTRMNVIKNATQRLIKAIHSACPNCNTPGFSIVKAKQGLKCSRCNFPTRSTISYIFACKKCNHSYEQMYPHNKLNEDPMFCDICNP